MPSENARSNKVESKVPAKFQQGSNGFLKRPNRFLQKTILSAGGKSHKVAAGFRKESR